MKTKEDKLKLIQETVLYYSENVLRRCMDMDININGCFYFGGNNCLVESEGCAIGRLIPKELAESLDKEFQDNLASSGVDEIFYRLPLDIQDYGMTFLIHLQALHDEDSFWSETGLTDEGKSYVNDMVKIIG